MVITKKELRPWKFRICGFRYQTEAALLSHEKKHVSKKAPSKDIVPSARPGCVLPTELLEPEQRTAREEALYKVQMKISFWCFDITILHVSGFRIDPPNVPE